MRANLVSKQQTPLPLITKQDRQEGSLDDTAGENDQNDLFKQG